MTITTLAFSLLELVLPIKWLAGNHRAEPSNSRVTGNNRPAKFEPALRLVGLRDNPESAITTNARLPTPLRVVRVIERGQSRGHVGRMVISGRMADVCAELDRLAACEAV